MEIPGARHERTAGVVRSYYRRVDSGDAAMFELFDQDIEYRRPGYPLISGIEALRDFYRRTRVIAEGTHSIDILLATGSRAAVEGRFRGVLRNGTRVDLAFSDFFELTEGGGPPLIRSRRTYFADTSV
ncbi:MAG: nuclear transport factor 2 family protein [Streptomycetaceae bacterium]|nr:nuclear transport factor 2 family protein [Streptomycetaceae bacterium]